MVADVVEVYQTASQKVVSQMPLSDEELTRQHGICQANAIEAGKKLLEHTSFDTDVEDDKLGRIFQGELADLQKKNREAKHQQDLRHSILKDITCEYRKGLQQVVDKMPLLEEDLIQQHDICQTDVMEFKNNLLLYTSGDIDVEDGKLEAMFEEGMAELQMKNHEATSKQDVARTAVLTSVLNGYKNALKQICSQMPLSDVALSKQHELCQMNAMETLEKVRQYARIDINVKDDKMEKVFADGWAELKQKNSQRLDILKDLKAEYSKELEKITSEMPLSLAYLTVRHEKSKSCAIEYGQKMEGYATSGVGLEDPDLVKIFVDGWADIKTKNLEARITAAGYPDKEATTPDEKALIEACKEGRLNEVRRLVESGVNMEVRGWRGLRRRTGLMWASMGGHVDIVLYLIQNGADVNKTDGIGQSALWKACCNGHLEVVKVLVENGADVNNTNSIGQSALWWPCYNGHLEVVKLLVENGADITRASNDGWTPLMIARQSNKHHIVDHLTRLGAT